MSASKSKADKGEATKSRKDERYENMLKKIELSLEAGKSKGLALDADLNDDDGFNTQSKDNKKGQVSLMDLVSNLQTNEKATGNASLLKSHLSDLANKATFREAPSARVQEEMDRKANFQVIKKDIQKWQGIIKKNREAPHLDFTQKSNEKFSINNNKKKGVTKTALENKVESKLKELNLLEERDFLEQEKEMLKKLNPDEAKRREVELAKHRNLMFYKELKNKRVAKIKSKLYHKIKKKREIRMQLKMQENMDQSDPALQLQQIADMEKQRAEERMRLRHKNKSKYVQNLLRYGDKKEATCKYVSKSVNDLAYLRREILKKIDATQKERLEAQLEGENGGEVDDQEFRRKLIEELEDQLKEDGEEQENDESGKSKNKKLPGFMKRLLEQQKATSKKEAAELLESLKATDNLEDLEISDEEGEKEDNEEDPENPQEKKDKKKEKKNQQAGSAGRKKFHKDPTNTGAIKFDDHKKDEKQLSTNEILRSYVDNFDEQPQIEVNPGESAGKSLNLLANVEKINHLERLEPKDLGLQKDDQKQQSNKQSKKEKKKQKKNANKEENKGNKQNEKSVEPQAEKSAQNNGKHDEEEEEEAVEEKSNKNKGSANKDDLVAGLNFGGLKQKYTKKANNSQYLNEEIEKFNEENKQDIYNDLANFQIMSSNIYDEEFTQEKDKLLEEELPPERKGLKGWGTWAGIGIQEKKVDPEIELKKKLQKMAEMKKQRKDGNLNHVIINEQRNKKVAKYLVTDLPHPYRSSDQFDYLHGVPLGPEWNTLRSHQKLIKPKVITKAGEVINPIKYAKKGGKQNIH